MRPWQRFQTSSIKAPSGIGGRVEEIGGPNESVLLLRRAEKLDRWCEEVGDFR